MPPLRLWILPCLGLVLLAAAWFWPGRVGFSAERQPAEIAGVLLRHGDSADLVDHLEHEVALAFADGSERRLAFTNYAVTSTNSAEAPSLSALLRLLRGGPNGAQSHLGRLHREFSAEARSALLRLSVVERVSLLSGLPPRPASPLPPAPDSSRSEVLTRATWEWPTPSVGVLRPRATQKVFERIIDATPDTSPRVRRELFLAAQPRDTLLVPLFRLGAENALHVADFGRLGTIHPSTPLFTHAFARPDEGGQPRLLPSLDGAPAGTPALERFSHACEALFTRAAYPVVFALGSLLLLITGALLLSLHFHAPENF